MLREIKATEGWAASSCFSCF